MSGNSSRHKAPPAVPTAHGQLAAAVTAGANVTLLPPLKPYGENRPMAAENKSANALATIASVTKANNLAALEHTQLDTIQKDLQLASALGQLRQLISGPVLEQIKSLQGHKLGFLTDRDRGTDKQGNPLKPYPDHVVRDCAISAMLQGARLTHNEFNIIAGDCYLAKNFYSRMLTETMENLHYTEEVPEIRGQTALVPMVATFHYQGKRHQLDYRKTDEADRRLQVRVNAGMGPDAISGKAYKKLAKRIYCYCTQTTWLQQTDDDQATIDQAPEPTPAIEDTPRLPETLAELREILGQMVMIGDVQAYCARMSEAELTDQQRKTLDAECKRRMEEIRDSRGERSNGKHES